MSERTHFEPYVNHTHHCVRCKTDYENCYCQDGFYLVAYRWCPSCKMLTEHLRLWQKDREQERLS